MSRDMRVIVQYMEDIPEVPGPDGHRAYVAGETYRVSSVAAAKTHHPLATIVAWGDGTPYAEDKAGKKGKSDDASGDAA